MFKGFFFKFFVLFLMIKQIELRSNIHWDYGLNGPDVWPEIYSQCGGENQSPVNIRTSCTKKDSFDSLILSSSHWIDKEFILINNGHTIQGIANDQQLYLSGINLNGLFIFQNFHLHWGENHRSGSEHQINGEKYSGEVHFVYKNLQTNELSVLSFLMRSSERKNIRRKNHFNSIRTKFINEENVWHKYFLESHNLIHQNDSKIVSFRLRSLMGENINEFWRYKGSLTTPPCDENVQWTIFRQEILLNDFDFQYFRDDLFFESYRGPQPIHQRIIFRNFDNETQSTNSEQQCCQNKSSSSSLSLSIIIIFVSLLF